MNTVVSWILWVTTIVTFILGNSTLPNVTASPNVTAPPPPLSSSGSYLRLF